MIVGDDDRGRSRDNRAAEYFAWCDQGAGQGAERDEMPAQRMILAIKVNAVERLLQGFSSYADLR